MKTDETIPKQQEGNSSDTEEYVDSSTQRQAHSSFVDASRRLLNINNWGDISGAMSATFQLTDDKGVMLDRPPRPGDYIRINIPGPGTSAGRGYDWVHIEAIEDRSDPAGRKESLTMRVRPTSSPANDESDVAHFFDEDATSTFVIERNDLRVSASVHGRNEMPNKDVQRPTDKMRNTIVANAATSGMSKLQWSLLTKGLVKDL
jgi:hypothetical protein